MRLLQLTQSGLTLVERIGQDIPPYAILSHTWGADEEEVTYSDLLHGKGQDKAGYQKLQFCMQQARNDALDYFWIDTCCIDKSSSSELTEAITSMYRWYQHATVCYVYLSDVHVGDKLPPLELWRQSFTQSRWFSRGWTLQELIAPINVKFFSFEKKYLGSKASLDMVIHNVTGINLDVLRGIPLSRITIQERLSWATGRVTKRAEDDSYALMGIFNVYMPAIYGEGQRNARIRLLEQIEARYTVRLPSAEGAAFCSHLQQHGAKCLPNTRIDLLDHLSAWANFPMSKSIFWLNGMAGTGKSTIARTLASTVAEKGQLGATFFFKSSEVDLNNAKRLFTTIAVSLAESFPEIVTGIKESIREDRLVHDRPLEIQFEKLILKPLRELATHLSGQVVKMIIIIDALDECGQDEDIREILRLLPLVKDLRPIQLRIFLTSRPELPIRLGFRNMSHIEYEDMILHEIPPSVVQGDIEVFIWHELTLIRDQRSLPPNWPTASQVRQLAELATPLFIFAATACRYIGETKHNPQRRLELMLGHVETKSSKLDATYLPIMNLLFEEDDEDDKDYWATEFRAVVGSIILLVEPLSVDSISLLTGMSKFDIGCRLDALHSVLSVPEDDNVPVRLLHLSFRDFLLDPKKQGRSPLWIDERKTHEELAFHCLNFMYGPHGLHSDMSTLLKSGHQSEDYVDEEIPKNSTLALRYACQYWVEHTVSSKVALYDNCPVHAFLQEHFLHWLEAMSLMERGSDVPGMLNALRDEAVINGTAFRTFLDAADRFANRFKDIIYKAPSRLYDTALLFSPESCIIRSTFAKYIHTWPEHSTFMGYHEGPIHDIRFSGDGKLVASTSSDQLRIWNTMTGECIFSLEECTPLASAVMWSGDARMLASPRVDGSIHLWNASKRSTCATLSGHTLMVNDMQFSRTGKLLLSASEDKTVRIWNTSIMLCQATLVGHAKAVRAVVFSPDDSRVASASDDRSVIIWDTATGKYRYRLSGHTATITSVNFSRNGKLLASISDDCTVRVWSFEGEAAHCMLQVHSFAAGAVFHPSGDTLATADNDGTVILWDIKQGTHVCIVEKHTPTPIPSSVKSPSISPEGDYIDTNHGRVHISLKDGFFEATKYHALFATTNSIIHKREAVLSLPAGFEPSCSARHGNTICLGHTSGSWTLFRFDDEGNLKGIWMFDGSASRD
ncbi:vegetative incompatibility protein HET-E-1 [Paraphoma chrysanthemicola]|nr:vegetative incompatibility protein HET-E-1 [Paraphoma chrysanthemicola]